MTMKVVLLTIPLGQATLPHTPVQVWERGLYIHQFGLSPLYREVERFLLCPLSWERGPTNLHQFAWPFPIPRHNCGFSLIRIELEDNLFQNKRLRLFTAGSGRKR